MRRGLYTTEFEPVVQIGDVVKIIPKPVPEVEFWEVIWVEPVPELVKDFGSISAESSLDLTKITEIQLNDREFGMWRLQPLDDIEIIEIRYGGQTVSPMWTTKNKVGYVGKVRYNSTFAEIFNWEDDEVWIKIKNPTKYDISMSRLQIRGFVFEVQPYMGKPPAYTRIPLGSRLTAKLGGG